VRKIAVASPASDARSPLFVAAVAYFRNKGMVRVTWLNSDGEGYGNRQYDQLFSLPGTRQTEKYCLFGGDPKG
jgi:hypothetical protein